MVRVGSPALQLSRWDWQKVGKGALIAAAGATLVYLVEVVFPTIEKLPGEKPAGFILFSTLVNLAYKYLKSTEMEVLLWLAMAVLVMPGQSGYAQQIMAPARYEAAKSLIPRVKDHDSVNTKLQEALLYTKLEMPPAYQYQNIREIGGRRRGDPLAVFFDTAFPLDPDPTGLRKKNENEQFPWAKSGGLESVPAAQAKTFFAWWAPTNRSGSTGKIWPMVFYPAKLQSDPTQPNLVSPVGLKAMKPAGQLNADILVRTFSDGTQAPFEMRAILQELGDRDVERYMPKAKFSGMRDWFSAHGVELPEPKWLRYPKGRPFVFSAGNFVTRSIQSGRHRSFKDQHAWVYCMPPIPLSVAKLFLSESSRDGFEPMDGEPFAEGPNGLEYCFGVTANDPNNWVPQEFGGAHAGADSLSCASCHRDIGRHVNSFGAPLTTHSFWIGGFCDLHTINPIERTTIGPNLQSALSGQPFSTPAKLRKDLLEAGYVAEYDPQIHPDSVYRVMTEFDP